jgi:hypothetical protein
LCLPGDTAISSIYGNYIEIPDEFASKDYLDITSSDRILLKGNLNNYSASGYYDY